MTLEEGQQILAAAGIDDTDGSTTRSEQLCFFAMAYEREKALFCLPQKPRRTDPLVLALKRLDELRALFDDPLPRYYLAGAMFVREQECCETRDRILDWIVRTTARHENADLRVRPGNEFEHALGVLREIVESARFLAAEHNERRGTSKGFVAERFAVYRLAVLWKDVKGKAPTFTTSTDGKATTGRTGFNAFAFNFLEAQRAQVNAEFVRDTLKPLRGEGDDFWETMRVGLRIRDRLAHHF
ncbi:MAG TPA: hypothetical protein VEC57_16515 [Candidatus Limnocylindrales bacterium]|nr:hypothetical protein [Candidatus Limnocylindrales bacterium]